MITCLILGSGGAVPTPTRSPAAYWLTVDDHRILVDPGPGAVVRLLRSPDGPDSLDAVDTVLFTHFHPDHCADLVALLFAMHGPVLRSERPLQLIGPRGMTAYLEALQSVYGSWLEPRRPLVLSEIASGDVLSPSGDLWGIPTDAAETPHFEAFAADHSESRFSEENLFYRFRDREGCTLVYSGDSQSCAALENAARGADLFLVECSIPDSYDAPGHMTPLGVGRLCREAEPSRVVLTHIYPACDALNLEALVAEQFEGPVVRAQDGMVLHVPDQS